MKIRISIVINDPDTEDILGKLGPYRRVAFIREAIINFSKTEKGIRLFNRLMQRKNQKKSQGTGINLDDLL